jgi:CheY-like chemotaxis protein
MPPVSSPPDQLDPVLLVEDNEDHLDLTCEALEMAGLRNPLCAANSAQQARAYLRAPSCPCLIVMDIRLPDASGLDLLREVKQNPALRDVPVVILTTSDDRPTINAACRLGAVGHLLKPLDAGQLREQVASARLTWESDS